MSVFSNGLRPGSRFLCHFFLNKFLIFINFIILGGNGGFNAGGEDLGMLRLAASINIAVRNMICWSISDRVSREGLEVVMLRLMSALHEDQLALPKLNLG